MSSKISVSPVSKSVGNLLAVGDSAFGDFAFVHDGVEFSCNKLASCLFSSKVSKLLSSDITSSRLIVESKCDQQVFSKVIRLIEGEVVELENNEKTSFFDITTELGSEDFGASFYKNTKSVSFVASHFCKLERESLLSLDVAALSLVLSSKSLKILSDEWLFEFIEEHKSNSKSKSKSENSLQLLEFVEMSLLPLPSLSRFISAVEESSLFSSVWPSMKRMLFRSDHLKQKTEKETQMPNIIKRLKSNGTVRGLFNHIYSTDRGSIQVTASSTYYNTPEAVLDGNEGSYWYSNDVSGSSLTVSLSKRRIRAESYVLRSHCFVLMSWKLEGRSFGVWKTIDTQSKSRDFLNEKTQTLPLKSGEAFDAFRITQTGKSSTNYDYFLLNNFDVFGELEICD